MFNGYRAMKIVAESLHQETDSFGPSPLDAPFSRICNATSIGETVVEDYFAINGMRLRYFTDDDAAVWTKVKLTELWESIVVKTKQYWNSKYPGKPFPSTNFTAPQVFDAETTLSHLQSEIILDWGDLS